MMKKIILMSLLASAFGLVSCQPAENIAGKEDNNKNSTAMDTTKYKVNKTDEEWKKELTPEQYEVLRQKGTERPGTGEYNNFSQKGVYVCAACGTELFTSDQKFDSHCG